MCHGGCGVLVHVRNVKVVRVQDDPESPLNRGRMCLLTSNAPSYDPAMGTYQLRALLCRIYKE
jgi:anaerobic selenocysteine-containing dehydrogenase